jgi:hypothetical protein
VTDSSVRIDARLACETVTDFNLTDMMAVKWYGETEFWAAIGKVLLIIGLLIFTFISMLGGNPEKDRYGFRYWKNPGSFTELYYEGQLGRFLGFLQCLIQASFTIAGPDYVSMAAGETENPRKVMPRAYNAVFYRLTAFFVLGSLAVGINVPFNDPDLIAAFKLGKPGAAASPYVIAMNRLRIEGLPHVVNAGVLASAFSAGNSYVYCASRSLFGLALEGKAPRILTKCTKQGVPFYCGRGASDRTPLVPAVGRELGRRAQLVRQPGDGVAVDQLQRHVLYVSAVLQGVPGARARSQYAAVQRPLPAVCGVVWLGHDIYHDVCGWVYGVFEGAVGCAEFLIFVPHGELSFHLL